MVKSLENLGIVPLQFRLDSHRPDLTKVDTLLGLLASECSFFPVQVDAVAQALRRSECRLAAALEQMKDLPFPDQPLGKQGGEDEEEEGKGKQKAKAHDDNEPPEEFLCPITQELMKDPVVASDGHTYEKYGVSCVCVSCVCRVCRVFVSRCVVCVVCSCVGVSVCRCRLVG
jgi:hypothetical protein